MAHQVLARKWRPRTFGALVGQDHVVRALSNALGTGRLHHAYLFTGTRGVGKTTIARILAKSLNCETGVTATPCGRCRACVEIDEGRFPDYLEMDAASNRGVDDIAQVLDSAAYAPSAGRYRVFVIDEVHMLSNAAFNAMLKTLEEPPPHVVFILATTDPQKVPVTVLSRCLQFALRNMTPVAVAGHLAHVLREEGVAFEAEALAAIGEAAAGSMRDALSLLDQAIAFGAGEVAARTVHEMLGAVDRAELWSLLDRIAARDGAGLVAQADAMAAANAPFERVLSSLAALLQRIAVVQVARADGLPEGDRLAAFAARLAPEDVQVLYQIAIHGGRDLPLAPDPATGFTMALLRMLAFLPREAAASDPGRVRPAAAAASGRAGPPSVAAPASSAPPAVPPPALAPPALAPQEALPPRAAAAGAASAASAFDGDWLSLSERMRLRPGLVRQFLDESQLLSFDGLAFHVRANRVLSEPSTVQKVRDALSQHFGAPVRLTVEVGKVTADTASAVAQRARDARQQQVEADVLAQPFVRALQSELGATLVPGSIRPPDPPARSAPGEPTP